MDQQRNVGLALEGNGDLAPHRQSKGMLRTGLGREGHGKGSIEYSTVFIQKMHRNQWFGSLEAAVFPPARAQLLSPPS